MASVLQRERAGITRVDRIPVRWAKQGVSRTTGWISPARQKPVRLAAVTVRFTLDLAGFGSKGC